MRTYLLIATHVIAAAVCFAACGFMIVGFQTGEMGLFARIFCAAMYFFCGFDTMIRFAMHAVEDDREARKAGMTAMRN